MKQIEAFVDSVYQNVGGNKKEIKELKAEMKSHLLEAVDELKAEGKSEQEAIEIAIERFGGEREMRSVVGQLFKAQKTFAKWVLYLAVTFLFLVRLCLELYINRRTKCKRKFHCCVLIFLMSWKGKKQFQKDMKRGNRKISKFRKQTKFRK